MGEENPFHALLARVRQGDNEAAEQLVRQYEPIVRVHIRARLTDPRLHRVLDSMDICQSVMTSFFTRVALGQFELDNPGQLIGLLTRMAQYKMNYQVRYHHQQRRDIKRLDQGAELPNHAASSVSSAERIVMGRELLERFYALLTPEERSLVDLRSQGLAWNEIVEAVGGTADGRRKQLDRALDRVAPLVGLDTESQHDT